MCNQADGIKMITYCYILGYGRSGSTLLEWILSAQEGVLGLGELDRLPEAIVKDKLPIVRFHVVFDYGIPILGVNP